MRGVARSRAVGVEAANVLGVVNVLGVGAPRICLAFDVLGVEDRSPGQAEYLELDSDRRMTRRPRDRLT